MTEILKRKKEQNAYLSHRRGPPRPGSAQPASPACRLPPSQSRQLRVGLGARRRRRGHLASSRPPLSPSPRHAAARALRALFLYLAHTLPSPFLQSRATPQPSRSTAARLRGDRAPRAAFSCPADPPSSTPSSRGFNLKSSPSR